MPTWKDVMKLRPCKGTRKKYASLFPKDSNLAPKEIIKRMMKHGHLEDANWLIVRFMSYKQYVSYGVFATEQVIDIFEKKYPNDKRPRKAIEAAKRCIKNPSKGNRATASAAASAAASAYADATYAAASAAAYAASATTYAAASATAYAASAAASAYAAYADAAQIKMLTKILNNGLRLMIKALEDK